MAVIEQLDPTEVSAPDPPMEQFAVDEAGAQLDALTSQTARAIVVELGRDPAPASTVADRVGTSLQNAGYHLSRLEEAGLVTVVATRYSEKGHEMPVYAPAVSGLVLGGPAASDDRAEQT